ncbi:Broad-Complex, Tramtrack and Bric a brac [Teratosphaeria destructans]|uniref:Broad-Complex, Tramtrack and Bric a brac n=1 Tax=Teratosphaeria destructans TaxID=418781 RepID=A0A9W7W197_9PEZI|nr:Broad-Complex, Tramtrack and Bric a brac [Teratosphaeria destructans]
MPTLSTTDFYQDKEYSDVILKYSDRTFHAHKFIICRASEYFKKLCGPGSAFAESEAKVIELKDDTVDALDAVLRYIYTGKYCSEEDGEEYQKRSWEFNIDVSITANKYMIDTLSKIAWEECKSLINRLTDVQEVFDALEKMPEYEGYDASFSEIAANLREKHLKSLLKLPAFRAQMETNTEDMWKMIERLSFASSIPSPRHPHHQNIQTTYHEVGKYSSPPFLPSIDSSGRGIRRPRSSAPFRPVLKGSEE